MNDTGSVPPLDPEVRAALTPPAPVVEAPPSRGRWLAVVALAVCIVLVLVVTALTVATRNVAATSEQGQRSANIAACRTQYFADVTAASTDLSLASASIQILNTNGLVATAESDPAALRQAIAEANVAVAQLVAATPPDTPTVIGSLCARL